MVSFFFDFYHPTQLHKSEKKIHRTTEEFLGLLAQLSLLKYIAFFVLLSYGSKSAEVDSNNGRSVCWHSKPPPSIFFPFLSPSPLFSSFSFFLPSFPLETVFCYVAQASVECTM